MAAAAPGALGAPPARAAARGAVRRVALAVALAPAAARSPRAARAARGARRASCVGARGIAAGAAIGSACGCAGASARRGRRESPRGDARGRAARTRAVPGRHAARARTTLPGALVVARAFAQPPAVVAEIALALAASAFFATSTLELPPAVSRAVDVGEFTIQVCFLVAYMLRWYSKNLRLSYLLQVEMVFDFLSFLPLLLAPFVDQAVDQGIFFAMLRLGRVLRVQRFLRDRKSFAQLVGAKSPDRIKQFDLQLVRTISSIATLVFISSGLMYNAEHEVNPQFTDFFAAFYFGLVTVTTVGFGDMAPVTPEGRAIVCLSILAGVAVIPFEVGQLAEAFVDKRETSRDRDAAREAQAAAGLAQVQRLQSRVDEQQARLDAVATHVGLGSGNAGGAGGAAGAAPPQFSAAVAAAAEAATLAAAPAPTPDATAAPAAAASLAAASASPAPRALAEQPPAASRPGRCASCSASGHRHDAVYCFRCGDRLQPGGP